MCSMPCSTAVPRPPAPVQHAREPGPYVIDEMVEGGEMDLTLPEVVHHVGCGVPELCVV